MKIHQSISEVVIYYARQRRPVMVAELHRYMTSPISKNDLSIALTDVEDIVSYEIDGVTYVTHTTAGQAAGTHHTHARKETIKKLQKVSKYIKILQKIPWIRMIALTGSCGIDNAAPSDDIDLLIIVRAGRLYLTRLIVTTITLLCGLKRSPGRAQHADKVCINLWLDESDLRVPESKHSLYAARELAQMKVIHDVDQYRSKLFAVNQWVYDYLPNLPVVSFPKIPSYKVTPYVLESLARRLQLVLMRRHQTHELVTSTQLWFHPIDRSYLAPHAPLGRRGVDEV